MTMDANAREYNVTGHDYSRREHLTYAGPPIIDIHSHVTMTAPSDGPQGPAGGAGAQGRTDQAATMLDVAAEFGVGIIYSMCPPQDIAPLRARFGDRLHFNGSISKRPDDPDDVAFRNLEQFLEAGIEIVKLWAAPRGVERGLYLDTPWRIEGLKRARAAGIRVVMVHVGDPDNWWKGPYQDIAKFGTKADQYRPLERMLEMFPDMAWIGAHMGGDPEHPDHLEALLERYPNLHFDTSATKWQVREVSARPEPIWALICRHPDRFLFGSDVVTRHMLDREHYVSRYWCHRTLWESTWVGPSPIADPDYQPVPGDGSTPTLRGLGLPHNVLVQVYHDNAQRLVARRAV
jgi:predicted TIM-barrel fold metal-dependent hydrolase